MWVVRTNGTLINISHASHILIHDHTIKFVVHGEFMPIHESKDDATLERMREYIIDSLAGGKLVCDLREMGEKE